MGYVTAFSPCGACKRPFTYNPNYVPSLKGAPFCESCIKAANKIRGENGLEPLLIHPQAYEPLREEELR